MLKRILIVFLFFYISCFLYLSKVYAEDYSTDYQVEYYLSDYKDKVQTEAYFTIQITNLRSDMYVSRFSVTFPKTFLIRNIKANDDFGIIQPKVTTDNSQLKIDMEFSKPKTGRGSVNTFNLRFQQDNLFKENGNVWEVILPTIENRGESNYKAIVHLPVGSDKKISIAKPKPTLVTSDQIIWENPPTRTIYAVFGETQIYDMSLNYHVKNPKIIPVYTEIALPPDTLYQKTYIHSLKPEPSGTKIDEDGNLLAKYLLKPKETLDISYKGSVEIFSKPRSEIKQIIASQIDFQKKYLLTSQKYWEIKDLSRIQPLKTVADVYHFTRDSLRYDYKRLTVDNSRLGANVVLQSPEKAVCVEFSDLFIAAAREKGIYSREVEGYGFSFDPQIRPLSLVSDVLHSWPEYFDTKSGLWIPVDPTWENTSGIDYFSSFDLNHITFAIHGKRPDYPMPAGMYKIESTRDISINVSTQKPEETESLIVESIHIPKKISDTKPTKMTFIIINRSNVYNNNVNLIYDADKISFSPDKTTVLQLAPYEQKEITIEANPMVKNKKITTFINIRSNNKLLYNSAIIIFPDTYDISIKISGIVAFVFFVLLLFKLANGKIRNHA